MDDLEQIYTDLIMEQSVSKHNRHKVENETAKEHGHNPSCGDDITIELRMKDDIIEDIAFSGQGCAISQASTSIMIDLVKGRTKEEATELVTSFMKMMHREEISEEEKDKLEDAMALENVSNMPARVKCATLAWHTLEAILSK